MKRASLIFTLAGSVAALCCATSIHAAALNATDLASLSLGAKIVGPVGPEVETTIAFTDGSGAVIGIADLISSVSCDARFTTDCSASAVSGVNDAVYTYQHVVTPGVDLPNDPPFPAPDAVVPFDGVTEFALQFPASGFIGVAGYDFTTASAALGAANIGIEQRNDGRLIWTVPSGAAWDTNETLTFFWRTTQRPSGPGGTYSATNGALSGVGAGPLPAPIPLPGSGIFLLSGLALLRWRGKCLANGGIARH